MIIAAAFLFIALDFYIPGTGGTGVALPYNVLFIGWVGLILLLFSLRCTKREMRGEPQPLIIVGALLLVIPWLFQAEGNPGVWVMLIALVLWSGGLQLSLSERHKRFVLNAVFILAQGQSALCIVQALHPHLAAQLMEYDWLRNHGRPYGIFQQTNLLASFLATGLGCGFLLLHTEHRRYVIGLNTVGLGLLAFCLALSQSRAGALGAVFVLTALTWSMGRSQLSRTFIALSVMVVCAALGWYITQHLQIVINGEPYFFARSYEYSTRERWNILLITWQMIMQHPWAGWGYGRFEFEFSRYVLAHPELPYTYSSIVTHPHNELLYAWFQGGVVALLGILTFFAGWGMMVIRGWRHSHQLAAYGMLIVPLLVHLNLEYPFYQSFVHFGLFLILLRLGVVETPASEISVRRFTGWPRGGVVLLGLVLLVFSATGLYANHQLTALERSQFAHFPQPAPWYFTTQFERAQFDGMVARLINYNMTRNEADLDVFMSQAEQWSQRHNDRNVWGSMMMITRFRGEQEKLARMQLLYDKLFPLQPQ